MLSTGSVARRAWIVFGVLLLITLIATLWVRRLIFTEPAIAWGDDAANGLLVQQAKHFTLLEGHYSRTGTNHPGPDWLYLLAAGETLFSDWLHLVPAPFNGDLLAQAVIQCVVVAAVGGVVAALTRRPLAGLVIGAATFWGFIGWFGAHPFLLPALGNIWPPFASFTFMAAVVPFAVAVAAGRTAFLPGLVLAGGLLVHTHVAFFFVFGVTFVGIVISWVLLHRGGIRAELAAHRTALILAGVALVLVVGPIVLRTALDWPDPWSSWFGFSGSVTQHPSWAAIRNYLLSDLALIGLPLRVYLIAAVLAVVLVVLERDPWRRRLAITAYAVIALFVALTVAYVRVGVDHVEPVEVYGYIVIYVLALPPMFLGVVAVHLVGVVIQRVGRGERAARVSRVAAVAVAVIAVLALYSPSLAPDSRASTVATNQDRTRIVEPAERIVAYARAHGTVGVYAEDPSVWPDLGAVVLEAHRRDPDAVCVDYAKGSEVIRQTLSGTLACGSRPDALVEYAGVADDVSGTVLARVPARAAYGNVPREWVVTD